MERKIINDLNRWKRDSTRKPLLIYGNKQVGKTYTVLEFGETAYKTTAYFDCSNNLELFDMFKREKSLDKIILKLSLMVGEQILKQDTLIIFDNVKELELVKVIKRISKEAIDYHIIMITSDKEKLPSFKGDEFQFKYMFSMDFEEYLKAIKQDQLIDFIKDSYKNNKAMPFHNIAIDYYENYLMTGGLPEAILTSLDKSDTYLNMIHHKVIDTYQKEFLNMPVLIDVTRAIEVFNIVPYQLLKPNKKFQYGLITPGSRAKEYENAISFLNINGYLNKAYRVTDVKSPLSKHKDNESFKLYMNDTGLLFNTLHLNKIRFLSDDRLKYIMYENAIASNIVASGYNLYYYQSEGKAEISFVVQTRNGKIIPIELVNKNIAKSKSLALFMNKYQVEEAIRVTEDNFSFKKGVKYIPIYATFCFKENL
ncbi:MAG: DUF4143 domain-containing protein [Bacilli bacterium]